MVLASTPSLKLHGEHHIDLATLGGAAPPSPLRAMRRYFGGATRLERKAFADGPSFDRSIRPSRSQFRVIAANNFLEIGFNTCDFRTEMLVASNEGSSSSRSIAQAMPSLVDASDVEQAMGFEPFNWMFSRAMVGIGRLSSETRQLRCERMMRKPLTPPGKRILCMLAPQSWASESRYTTIASRKSNGPSDRSSFRIRGS